MKHWKERLISSLVSLTLIALGGASFYQERQASTADIRDNMYAMLQERTEDQARRFRARIDECFVVLETLASGVTGGILTSDALIDEAMREALENRAYSALGYAGSDGVIRLTTGVTGDVHDRDFYLAALSGERAVERATLSSNEEQTRYLLTQPVLRGGRSLG